jgi:ribonuclease D
LIQFAVRGESLLIDPLAIEDLSPLGEFLKTATVWMHGADYDMTMFKREFGSLPAIIYDTQIGARLLGVKRFGLGDLVEQYFDITLSKSSQKADWGKRPLSEKMIEYALNDVDYLLEMADKIVAQLRELGRYDWFVESCAAARQKVLDRTESPEDNWRIQGSGKLSRHGLAYLKGLWHWRDGEAKAWDRPSFMVLTNRQMLEWCDDLANGHKVQLPNHYRPDRLKRFHAAIKTIKELPEAEWPIRPTVKRQKRNSAFESKLDALIKTRNTVAESLDIDGSLIAPRAVLEALAADQADAADVLLNWQRQCLNL